jgi:hypothetical protein
MQGLKNPHKEVEDSREKYPTPWMGIPGTRFHHDK